MRLLNWTTGKAQSAIYELINALPLDSRDDIRTRLLYDDARIKLLAAFRSCELVYAITSPPAPPLSPCPCGCDTVGSVGDSNLSVNVAARGAGTHSE